MPTPLFVFGGWPGSERAVSLVSSQNVFQAALAAGIDARTVTVSPAPDGTDWRIVWDFGGERLSESEGVGKILRENGIVFPVIHGEYGEDGTLQKILESAEIPFVGSGSESMALTINKQETGVRLSSLGFRTPKSVVVTPESDSDSLGLEFPVIVKPKSEGSSVSLYKPASKEELSEVLSKEFAHRSEILVQEFVSGREFTCGVIGTGDGAEALVPTEVILTQGELFDYDAKYRAGACLEVTPAEVEAEVFERIRQTAKNVHAACGCRDLSRTDMILNAKGELVVLEINTIPGMTGTSFVPAQLKAVGSDLQAFVRNVFDIFTKLSKKWASYKNQGGIMQNAKIIPGFEEVFGKIKGKSDGLIQLIRLATDPEFETLAESTRIIVQCASIQWQTTPARATNLFKEKIRLEKSKADAQKNGFDEGFDDPESHPHPSNFVESTFFSDNEFTSLAKAASVKIGNLSVRSGMNSEKITFVLFDCVGRNFHINQSAA